MLGLTTFRTLARTACLAVPAIICGVYDRPVEAQAFLPKPLLSTKERIEKAKEWLTSETARQKHDVMKALDQYVAQQRREELKKRKGNKGASGVINLKKLPAELVRDRYERDGTLPTIATGFPQLKEIREMAGNGGLHKPLTRVRLAYSDLIRECRQNGRLMEAERLEAEAAEFLRSHEYKFGDKIETILDLYGYDLQLAIQWFHASILEDTDFKVDLVCQGLSLPPDSPTAPHWKRLVAVKKRVAELKKQAAPIEEAYREQRASALRNAVLGAIAGASSDSFRGTSINLRGEVVGSYATELSELALEISGERLGDAKSASRKALSLQETLELIQIQANLSVAKLASCMDEYYPRRAAQLKLPMDESFASIARSSSRITCTSQKATGDVYISFVASSIPEDKMPRALAARISSARSKLENPKLVLSHYDINKDLQEAKKEWNEFRRPIRGSLEANWKAGGKLEFTSGLKFANNALQYRAELSKEQLEQREISVFVAGESFQATYKLPPTR